MKLSLAVLKDGAVVESALLCWSPKLYNRIVPKRKPERLKKVSGKMWGIDETNRDSFVEFVNEKMEDHANETGLNLQECSTYFSIVGIASRYLKDHSVNWVLFLGREELEKGVVLA